MASNEPGGNTMSQRRQRPEREHGQIIVLFVFALIVIMGAAAIVIDVGVLRNDNQNLWNALDAGALAGDSQLPADATNASTLALQFADKNYPGGLPAGVTVGFRCVVGSVGGVPRASDIPAVCDPGSNASWTCNATICQSTCLPAEGDTCNTVVLESTAPVPYTFAGAMGLTSGNTRAVLSAACKGPCGTKPDSPVDLVVIVDRTPSMEAIDVVNARTAADAVRKQYNPADQWIAFGMIGPSENSGGCLTAPAPALAPANIPADLRRWTPVGLSGIGAPINQNYSLAGSTLAVNIQCFVQSSGTVATDLEDPIPAAQYELLNNGRPISEVTKGIILMTDGQPNNSVKGGRFNNSYNYCQKANDSATAAKAKGIEIFTIGFGLDGRNINCLDQSGPFRNVPATRFLASMATQPSVDGGCPGTSNDDGDHFYCVPKSTGASPDLAALFRQAANALVGGTKLIQLP